MFFLRSHVIASIFGSCLTLLVAEAHAACQQWGMDPGYLEITQSNGYVVYYSFVNGRGNTFIVTGSAYYRDANRRVDGDANGTIQGNKFSVVMAWHNGTQGHYTGEVDAHGNIQNGVTEDVFNPGSPSATWWLSRGQLKCLR
jgi:hypothetical protein